jgi:hypothetical protein
MLLETRQVVEVRGRSKGEHQVVVNENVLVLRQAVANLDAASLDIDSDDLPAYEVASPKQRSNGTHDVRDVEIARRDLVQHRREQEEVVTIDERNFNGSVTRQQLLEAKGGIQAAEAGTQNGDTRWSNSHG